MPTPLRRFLPALVILAAVAATAGALLAWTTSDDASPFRAAACPPGTLDRAEQAGLERAERRAIGGREATDPAGIKEACAPLKRPEATREILAAKGIAESRDAAPYTAVNPRAHARAARQRAALAAEGNTLPGSAGNWTPYGKGPLLAGEEGFDNSEFGFRKLNGRVTDFAHAGGSRVFAAVGTGGLWESTDLGANWKPIGDNLPVQSLGSVGFTRADGQEVIIALTGDNAFGGNTYGGAGAFRTTDGGKTWTRSAGLPDGALGFKVAVDPTDPKVIYAATGLGLFRSADAGVSFTNVVLPTSDECAGDEGRKRGCFFANMVTDVVVQAPDEYGNEGGAVLAAVGWRAGREPDYQGVPQAPGNGIYTSETGEPGTFEKRGFNGIVPQSSDPDPQDAIGRTELGIAKGADQNHDYVYAIVQDATLFNKRKKAGIDVGENVDPIGIGVDPTNKNTALNGLYVSPDFGASWRLLAAGPELQTPGNNSALVGVYSALGVGPGVQAWYNEWIQPNPTGQVGGAPTLLSFGLEEVWQNQDTEAPLNGIVKPVFKVAGRYFSGNTCQGGLLPTVAPNLCPTSNPPVQGTTTHPDQHSGMYVENAPNEGDVTLLAGNDGGVYTQTKPPSTELDNDSWGEGANEGFNTLIPYEANMAKDGTVYGGLQDNGGLKIQPDGKQINWQGGDGFFAAVDPDNSQIAYGEVIGGYMYRTVDGGKTSEFIDPDLTAPQFATPFKMDPLDAKHLIVGGRDIKETVDGPETTLVEGKEWVKVFDLGTRSDPGNPDAEPTPDDPDTQKNESDNNSQTAIDLHGDAAYTAYCAYCDPLTGGSPFRSGIATNVGGDKPPKRQTPDGWHIAEAKGLPERYVTGIRMDPSNPSTVYATVAGYYIRPYAPVGALGEDTEGTGGGHVFKSTDAGRTFKDITGNLPDVPATDIEFHGKQLVVGTNVGAFISESTDGGRWETLGKGIPAVPIYALSLKPDDPNLLIAATYGRGVYTYRFADPKTGANGPGGSGPGDGAPEIREPNGCAEGSGFKSVSAARRGRGVRLGFERNVDAPVQVDVFRVSQGRRVLRERLVARFTGRESSFTWNGRANRGNRKRVGDGYYFVRYRVRAGAGLSDVRRLVLRRARGRFTKRADFYRRATCDLLKTYKLERPVFGGRRNGSLGISFKTVSAARVQVTVTRGTKTIRRFTARDVQAGRTTRLRLPARRLAKGDYRVRIVATGGGTRVTSVLTSRRL